MSGENYPVSKFNALQMLWIPADPATPIQVTSVHNALATDTDEARFLIEENDHAKRQEHLKNVHENGHFDSETLVKTLRNMGITWNTLARDAKAYVSTCLQCLRYNYGKTGYHPMTSVTARSPMDHLGLDFYGPYPVSLNGFIYVLLIVDICSRFVFLRPTKDKTAATVAKVLLGIFADFGFPQIIQTDNDPSFANALMDEFTKLMRTQHRFATPYHLAGNGLAERKVQSAKLVMAKVANGNLLTFDEHLPFVQLAMNLRESSLTKSAPFSLFLARHFNCGYQNQEATSTREPLTDEDLIQRFTHFQEAVLPAIHDRVTKQNQHRAARFNKDHKLITFKEDSYVMLKPTGKKTILTPAWTGPFKILKKTTGGSYILETLDGSVHPTPAAPNLLKPVSGDFNFESPSYAIERILNHRQLEDGTYEYQVKWRDYSSKENSWEPFEHFNSLEKIQEYWKAKKLQVPNHAPQPKKTSERRQRLEGGDVDQSTQRLTRARRPPRQRN